MGVVEAVVFVLFKETFLVGKWHVTSPRHCHCLRLQADSNHFSHLTSVEFHLATFLWSRGRNEAMMSDVQPLQRETVPFCGALGFCLFHGILCEAFLTSFDWDPQLWSCRQVSSLAGQKRIHPNHEAEKNPWKLHGIVEICTVYMDSKYRTIPELEGERIQTLPNQFEDLVELRWALLVQAICDFTKASTRQRGERAVQINSTPGRSARMHGTKTHKTPTSDCNKKNICFLIFDEHVDICCFWYCTFWLSFYWHLRGLPSSQITIGNTWSSHSWVMAFSIHFQS